MAWQTPSFATFSPFAGPVGGSEAGRVFFIDLDNVLYEGLQFISLGGIKLAITVNSVVSKRTCRATTYHSITALKDFAVNCGGVSHGCGVQCTASIWMMGIFCIGVSIAYTISLSEVLYPVPLLAPSTLLHLLRISVWQQLGERQFNRVTPEPLRFHDGK